MTDLRELGESAANTVLEQVGRGVSKIQERRPLAHDLLESDDAYLVVFDAPGAEREDIQVRFLDNEVTVRVDRFREFQEGFEMRLPGRGLSLSGSADLPADASVDPTRATATLAKSGALSVRIPKNRAGSAVAVDEESGSARDAEEGAGTGTVDAPDVDADSAGDAASADRAAGDVVDAVTDRDVDTSTDADTDTDDPDADAAFDEDAGDYGGAVTGDETNTGDVDVDETDEDRDGDGDGGGDTDADADDDA